MSPRLATRRRFLGALGLPAAVATAGGVEPKAFARLLEWSLSHPGGSEESARDEEFWFEIQQSFPVDRTIINLNNAGVSPSPSGVQEAMKRYLDYSNSAPAYSMWEVLEPQRESVRIQLAKLFGCHAEELALTRNASEGLEICQFGFDLQPGDEVLTTNQDYPRMITTWMQRERRDNITLRQFSLPVPAEDEAEIVSLFERHVTPRTRLILMCHMINLTGQILPVRSVVRMARERGIPVIVDGAHAFAQLDFQASDLECDYYASSLHKWLQAPHGTGMLYVRREKIPDLWPLMAAPHSLRKDIRKFEEIGTHPAANYLAVGDAVRLHEAIGPARKEARLRYLRNYWAERLMRHRRVRLHTSLKPEFSCGIATVQIEGIDSTELADHLWKRRRILVTPIVHPDFEGIRVSPGIYTTLPELDQFCDAMESVLRSGLK